MNGLSAAPAKKLTKHKAYRVLIADDVVSHRELMRYTLESSGYLVIEAETCEDAIAQVHMFGPDLIILDLNMPVMGGWAAVKALRGIATCEKIPILALTAADELTDGFERANFSEYLVKPVGPARLRESVSALL